MRLRRCQEEEIIWTTRILRLESIVIVIVFTTLLTSCFCSSSLDHHGGNNKHRPGWVVEAYVQVSRRRGNQYYPMIIHTAGQKIGKQDSRSHHFHYECYPRTRPSVSSTTTTTMMAMLRKRDENDDMVLLGKNPASANAITSKRVAIATTTNTTTPRTTTTKNAHGLLETTLKDYGWDDRIISLSQDTLPRIVEFQHGGCLRLGILIEIQFLTNPSDDIKNKENEDDKPPKLIVQVVSADDVSGNDDSNDSREKKDYHIDNIKVDFGQVTTIWPQRQELLRDLTRNEVWSVLQDLLFSSSSSLSPSFRQVDDILDQLYDSARLPGRPQGGGDPRRRHGGEISSWTKKELQKRIDQIPTTVSFSRKDRMEATLRQIAKGGPRHTHLVDSIMVYQALSKSQSRWSGDENHPPFSSSQFSLLYQQAHAVHVLAEHGNGRFKRFPCLFLSSVGNDPSTSRSDLRTLTNESRTVRIVNGGWIAVDSAVRASKEAKSLAETGGKSRGTNADERIIQRLESLAMDTNTMRERISREEDLQVDVREYLKALDLPCTSQGAKQALVNLGLWSSVESDFQRRNQVKPQPWSPEILKAVEWYRIMDQKRRTRLARALHDARVATDSPPDSTKIEGRIDLTHLPSICVDATRTSFRDDAMGIRPRATTGRKVLQSAKWEILLHTVDVSDLYAPPIVGRAEELQILQSAALKRSSSRYDLASGPSHLLPPALLEILALNVIRGSPSVDDPLTDISSAVNRCTTTWVYIDEVTGKILDSGMERTLISSPIAMTFQSATDLLEDDTSTRGGGDLGKARTMLRLIERQILAWKDLEHRQNSSNNSDSRDARLATREEIDALIFGNESDGDDGRNGFKRTRGHRLVDGCLDLQGYALTGLVRRANYFLPFIAGAQRDGRVATAPLRRYIDGVAQRQALSVLCGYGGTPYSREECTEIGLEATKAMNAISNVQSFKTPTATKSTPLQTRKQQQAARALQHILSSAPKQGDSMIPQFPAMSTGKNSEVVLLNVGGIAICEGIRGTLKPGEKIIVSIRDIDLRSGKIIASIVDSAMTTTRPKTTATTTTERTNSSTTTVSLNPKARAPRSRRKKTQL